MGYFETFYVQKINSEGTRLYRLKTLDTEEVESWEIVDENHTKVFMKSGDSFQLHINVQKFGEIIIDNEDAYGRILVFSAN